VVGASGTGRQLWCLDCNRKARENVMSAGVVSWWFLLCGVAILNVVAWSLAAVSLWRRKAAMSSESYSVCRMQLILSGAYVFGCAFRSVLPVYDIPRICLFDTWLSNVVVGRSVATLAELCFAGQWALMLQATARSTGSVAVRVVSRVLVPLIATAEACSWYAVLTNLNLGHVAENSIWAISAMLVIAAVITILPRYDAARRRLLVVWCMAGVAYVAFMLFIDVPMYWSRYLADEAHGRHYLSIAQGFGEASGHRVVSYRWDDWKSEVPWMTLYFSGGVWLSISLIWAHMPARRAAQDAAGPVRLVRAVRLPRQG
jgi:hypothetical protein